MKPLCWAVIGAACVVPGDLAVAQVPLSLDKIPVFPGAVRDVEAEREAAAEDRETRARAAPGLAQGRREEHVYRVEASVEAVVRFYVERLKPREIRTVEEHGAWSNGTEALRPGQTSPLIVEVSVLDFREMSEERDEDEKLIRARYERARPPYEPGVWLDGANFQWVHTVADGSQLHFAVDVDDAWENHPPGDPRYRNRTSLLISLEVSPPPAAEGVIPEPEEVPAAPLAPPSEAELGVPVYPGARFDPQMSGQLSSSGDARYFVYTSSDEPAKVLSFYERQTGKKAAIQSERGHLIAVRGAAPWPALGVSIEPNLGLYPVAVRTVITIRKTD